MVVCKYYLAGRCRYGDNCKFEHTDPPTGDRNSQGNDPFSTPAKRGNYNSNSNKDNGEAPQWPLSVVGIKDNAQQGNALEGDWSPEELRAVAYGIASRGLSNEVIQREAQLVSEHKAKVDAMNHSGMQGQASQGDNQQAKDPFAQNSGSAPNQGFGQPFQQSSLGQPTQGTNIFGQSQPFGTSAPTTQPFSQPQQGFSQPQQPPLPASASAPQVPLSSAAQEQFSAAQFGFSKVPESAPPPQFY